MKKNIKPITTLYMLISVDGKISTGDNDKMDFDKDLSRILGIKEGLAQYYNLEQKTDLYSLNTGKVMAKIGVNTKKQNPKKIPCSFIIIDNKPYLNKKGVEYLSKWVKKLYLVTTNKNHPAYKVKTDNIEFINYNKKIDFFDLFQKLKMKYGVKRLTIQSGGTLNTDLVRKNLIDNLSVVVAPCLVGGKDTSTLMDGISLHSEKDLFNIKSLRLKKCDVLKNSYLHLQYGINKDTKLIRNT